MQNYTLNPHQPFVDIWQGPLPIESAWLATLSQSLSPEEQQRAALYKTPELQNRYRSGRGLVRYVLSHYLQQSPAQIDLYQDEHGKPLLRDRQLSFNLSHSQNQIVLAVSNLACIGIDTEVIKPRKNLNALAKQCLGTDEWAIWQHQPDDQQLINFYRLWTIKEAFAKACGRGLAVGLANCVVDMHNFQQFLDLPAAYRHSSWHIAYSTSDQHNALAVVTSASIDRCGFYDFQQLDFTTR